MRTYNTTGIVLRRYDYRENDRLFVLLTPSHGKVEIVSRGTKKILSKLNPHLEPMSEVRVMVAKGKGFDKMANAIMTSSYDSIKRAEDISMRTSAHYILEMTDRLIMSASSEGEVFDKLKEVLSFWNVAVTPGRPAGYYYFLANIYALQLLDNLGYRPDLTRCTECNQGVVFPKTTFDLARGGLVCENCKPITIIYDHFDISDSVIKIMLNSFQKPYTQCASGKYNPDDMKEFNGIVSRLLEYQIEKPLNTLTFLREVVN